jgi:hypothetical protein
VAFPAGATSGLSEAQNPMQTSKLLNRFLKKKIWCGAISILPNRLMHIVLNVGSANSQQLEMIRSFAPPVLN